MNKRLIGSVTALLCYSTFYSMASFAKTNVHPIDNAIIFTCNDFTQKIQNCEPYSCAVLLLGTTTVTEIKGKKKDRCTVTFTIGSPRRVKNETAQKMENSKTPVAITCEYDQEGIEQLSNKYQAMKHGNFNFSSKQIEKGEYNCTTFALGQTFPTPKEPSEKTPEVSKAKNQIE